MMLFNRAGRIFVGKRIDQTLESWQMPQGGIDDGEDVRGACLRELKEEIGTDHVAFIREYPEWLTYDLPADLIGVALQGRYRGQTQKWFALKFLGADNEIDLGDGAPRIFRMEVGGCGRAHSPHRALQAPGSMIKLFRPSAILPMRRKGDQAMRLSRRQSLKTMLGAVAVQARSSAVLAAEVTGGLKRTPRLVVLDIGGTLIPDHGEVPEAMRSAFLPSWSRCELCRVRRLARRLQARHGPAFRRFEN